MLNSLTALNEDPHAWPQGRMDAETVGALGHSFGGAVGVQALRDGCAREGRGQSGWMDVWGFEAAHSGTGSDASLKEGSVQDRRKQFEGNCRCRELLDDQLDRADLAAVDAGLAKAGGYRMYVAGAQHMDFTDQPMLPPAAPGIVYGTDCAGRSGCDSAADGRGVLRSKPARTEAGAAGTRGKGAFLS